MMIIPHTAHTNQTEGAKIARSGKYTGGAPVDCFQTAFSFVSGWFQAHFWLVSGPFLFGFRSVSGWFQVRTRSGMLPFLLKQPGKRRTPISQRE
jgi:hypothetical protein